MNGIKVVAFDLFGTIFDFGGTDPADRSAYWKHIHQPEWSPLNLPAAWEHLPVHPMTHIGLHMLKRRFTVVTLSNAPARLQVAMLRNAQLPFDAIVPLELRRVFKPQPAAYLTVCDMLRVEPADVCMVTANRDFGDLEASAALGMKAVLIREPGCPQTVTDLAYTLFTPQPETQGIQE